MNSNIKKFDSKAAFDAYRATDGWGYPSVNYIVNAEESSIRYNNELIMRWNVNDTAKEPEFYGDISHDEFKAKIESLSKPCEIKKDGTDFAYLQMSGNTVADYTKRSNGSASHYNTADKADYIQMAEISNVNVGLFKDSVKGTMEVRFNFDAGCPQGFRKWFPNTTTGTKLFGRYDILPNSAGGVNVCVGEKQEGTFNWNANNMLSEIKKTGNFLEITYWEHLVMSYLFCAYFKTFNSQSIYTGIQSGSEAAARDYANGTVESTVKEHTGKVSVTGGEAYKFLHLENPLHGKQWIWGAGWVGTTTGTGTLGGQYWLTTDDIIANKAATLDVNANAQYIEIHDNYPGSNGDTGPLGRIENKYISKIDLYGVPTELNGSSTSGFYDAHWAYGNGAGRVAYLGGTSNYGASDGVFARHFYDAASLAYWNRRGRLTMNR